MRDSYVYETGEIASMPEVLGGTLEFSLSTASFATLKKTGQVRHRYLDIHNIVRKVERSSNDVDGILTSEGKGTFNIIVNNEKIEVPISDARETGESN